MPAVAYTSMKDPEWKDCGFFKWEVKLFITDKSGVNPPPLRSSSESWIIQHFVTRRQITVCDEQEGDPDVIDLYEAFRVDTDGWVKKKYSYDFKGDGTYTQVDLNAGSPAELIPVHDLWLNPNNGGTYGNFTMDGEMYAVDSIEPGEFSVDPQQQGPGQLPFTHKKPSGLGKPSLTRHAEGEWRCCGDNPKATIGKATATNRWKTYSESWQSDGTHTKTVDGKKV